MTGGVGRRRALALVGVAACAGAGGSRRRGGGRVVVDDGPRTRNNSLRTVAVTDDAKRIWFAGSSGALGA
jgi:hypothetical protein